MANYLNITLDTIAPSGVSVLINGNADKVTSTAVTLTATCSDADLNGYQMKIWGTAEAPTEDTAHWETYRETKNITLPSGDGVKTVYLKVRDDVWNESATASDSVTLFEKVPEITQFYINRSRISMNQGMNHVAGSIYVSENVDKVKLMLVQDANATYNSPSNVEIPKSYGSEIYDDNDDAECSDSVLELNGVISKELGITFTVYAGDIVTASPGDGVKILKVFVRSAETGRWSV